MQYETFHSRDGIKTMLHKGNGSFLLLGGPSLRRDEDLSGEREEPDDVTMEIDLDTKSDAAIKPAAPHRTTIHKLPVYMLVQCDRPSYIGYNNFEI